MATKKTPLKTSLNDRIDTLFGGDSQNLQSSQEPFKVKIDLLTLPQYQPRQYFDEESISSLAQSIKAHGILEPLLVRPLKDGKYEVVAGGRRYRASQLLSLTEIPVIILSLSDDEALEIAILENLQRQDLNPLEETEAVLRLLSARLNQDIPNIVSLLYRLRNESKVSGNVSPSSEKEIIESIFETVGIKPNSFVETRLPLLKLPYDILIILQQGKIAYTKAIALSKIKDEQLREELTQEAIKDNLSLREIKARIKELTEEEKETVEQKIDVTVKQIKKKKLWKNEPKKWKKVEQLLEKINILLDE
ncbi:ParB/RepB/Spo0J family partition protein (plasmid) [Cyanobacterium sp. IPPAS B-1200]|uniref:ParB/RepB/Spo0J family partition protein n=1 Tax=Cyanobacterium sp. IPPAS B-1200 TaxID=1562720 RepID=UPI0008526A39|nr:ParB/RepB/Spo0J family partition protein [Cyanobacterium sp. IPPAS B-1200]OEJ79989.1 chromosome partitioning protein ParB [Cyanobacterium sp. IPPAS B-1200]